MATVVESLMISLGVDSGDIGRDLNAAKSKVTRGANVLAKSLIAPISAALAGVSLGSLASQFMDTANEVGNLARELRVSTESLQGWQYAVESIGGSSSEASGLLKNFSEALTDIYSFNSSNLAKVAWGLGVSMRDASGHLKSVDEAILSMSDAFNKLDPTRAGFFGKQLGISPAMVELLRKGRGELSKLLETQKELGTFTREDIELSRRAKLSFYALKQAFVAASAPAARVLIPVMEKMSGTFTGVAVFLRKNAKDISRGLTVLAGVMTAILAPAFVKTAVAAAPALAAFAAAAAPVLLMGAAIAGVAAVIDDFVVYLRSGSSALDGFWSKFGTGAETGEKLQKTFERLRDFGVAAFKALTGGVSILIGMLDGFFSGLGNVLYGVAGLLNGIVTGDLQGIVDGVWDIIFGSFKAVWGIITAFTDALHKALKGVLGMVTGLIPDSLKNGVRGIFDAVTSVFGGASSTAVTSADSLPPSVTNNAHRTSNNTMSDNRTYNVTVNTAATDAQGTASAVSRTLKSSSHMTQVADTGIRGY